MPTIITINNNGSIRVEGDDFVIQDGSGNTFDLNGRTKIALCRCGKSGKMPFCDGKHKGEFQSEITAYTLPPLNPKPENPS
ncbi:MAG: CDGSH iron-sulfur domain-containing protein [Bacteroidia bacterium]|nr:CDGSH iron-sulfur domain-containing protein [Bacteroidia bacterium]